MEHVFRTLGKFLAISSAVKVYRGLYGDDIPQIEITRILNDLQATSNDYLFPKYVLKDNSLLDDVDIIDNSNDIGC